MLHFIIPLKSRRVAQSWPKTCALLEQTLRSVCNQSAPWFRVSVICHEVPELGFSHRNLEFCQVPFAPPEVSSEDDGPIRMFELRSDKGRKMVFGLALALEVKSQYVMFVDADDLVSRRLADYVQSARHPHGWVIERGFRMDEKHPWVVYPRRRFNEECGTSYILKTALAPFPERPDYTADLDDYYIRRYVVHAYVADNMEKLGRALDVLPFPGAVYVFNDQAIYSANIRTPDSVWRRVARTVLKGQLVTRRFRREFGISV